MDVTHSGQIVHQQEACDECRWKSQLKKERLEELKTWPKANETECKAEDKGKTCDLFSVCKNCDLIDPSGHTYGCSKADNITFAELKTAMSGTTNGINRADLFTSLTTGTKPLAKDALQMLVWKAVVEAGLIKAKSLPDPAKAKNVYWRQLGKELADRNFLKTTRNAEGASMDIPSGNCAFWTGGIPVSMYARSVGYTTLELTFAGYAFDEMDSQWGACVDDPIRGQAKPTRIPWSRVSTLWNIMSEEYAKGCEGEIVSFGRAIDPGSVWSVQEFNQLSKDEKVIKWQFLLGVTPEGKGTKETALASMIQAGAVTTAEINEFKKDANRLGKLVGCKGSSSTDRLSQKKCDVLNNNDIAMHGLQRLYEQANAFCRIRFTTAVVDMSYDKKTGTTTTATAYKAFRATENATISDWSTWTTAWTTKHNAIKELVGLDGTSKLPNLVLDVEAISAGNTPGKSQHNSVGGTLNAKVHGTDDAKKFAGWTTFCKESLEDFFAFAKNALVARNTKISDLSLEGRSEHWEAYDAIVTNTQYPGCYNQPSPTC